MPLPGRGRHLKALAEVVHRKESGPWETIGLRFRYMSPTEQAALDAYLGEQDWREVDDAELHDFADELV